MFDKILKNICSPAHLFWVIAMITIVYKGLLILSTIFTSSLASMLAGFAGLLWDLFWIYVVTLTLKKLCEKGYGNASYVASALFLIVWFKYDMSSPINLHLHL